MLDSAKKLISLKVKEADHPPSNEATAALLPEEKPAQKPAWPPPTRVRKSRSRTSIIAQVGVAITALLLVLGGVGLIIYSATQQFQGSVRTFATAEARATQQVISAGEATANALSTAQANIYATATAQGNQNTQATATVDNATATATANTDLYTRATQGRPALEDPLSDSRGPGQWDRGGSSVKTGCSFQSGGYYASEAQRGYLQPCIAQASSFDDFAYEAQVTITKGNQGEAGLLFRIDSANRAYYFFHIGADGSYALDLYKSEGSSTTLTRGFSPTIEVQGQANQLAVLARKDILYLYANNQYIATVTDNTLQSGKIGLAVVNNNTPVEAQFSAVKVWKS